LLAVQRAVLRLCAARGDLLAILSLPAHYNAEQAIAHVETLKAPNAPALATGASVLLPLGLGEASAFSYAALYHPWVIGQHETPPGDFRAIPPDGVACGVLAQRALARGAWVAPANEVLGGVVALTPPVARQRWLDLQTSQINLLRQEPQGFVALSADTLSADEDLRPINVRRLLILLRRLALRLGATYVFEPNDDAFRRLVQRGFEALLDTMFERGAFAGATPATAFQVVTSQTLNTPRSVDQGRFIVELRVRPSLPMTFLTVRLVQSGDHLVITEGR
jgi:phage tail sheath protein FI